MDSGEIIAFIVMLMSIGFAFVMIHSVVDCNEKTSEYKQIWYEQCTTDNKEYICDTMWDKARDGYSCRK